IDLITDIKQFKQIFVGSLLEFTITVNPSTNLTTIIPGNNCILYGNPIISEYASFRLIITDILNPKYIVFKLSGGSSQASPFTFPLLAPDSTSANPQYSFQNDNTTGIYRTAGRGGRFAAAVNGNDKMIFTMSSNQSMVPIRGFDGSSSDPSYSFLNGNNSGMFYSGSNLQFSDQGTTQLTVDGNTNTISVFNDLIIGNQILNSAGSSSSPSYGFTVTNNSGMFYNNELRFVDVGNEQMAINGNTNTVDILNDLTVTNQIRTSSGNNSLPPYSFSAENTSGMYLAGPSRIGLSANGSPIADLSSTRLSLGLASGNDDLGNSISIGNNVLSASHSNSPSNIIAIGNQNMLQSLTSTNTNTVSVGYFSLLSASGNAVNNTAIGHGAGNVTTTGSDNVFVGNLAQSNLGNSSQQVVIGSTAETGNFGSISIGFGAKSGGTDNICIGRATGRVDLGPNNIIMGTGTCDGGTVPIQEIISIGVNSFSGVYTGPSLTKTT
ncbi:MAG: hypothetical protein ACRC1D_04840, partial [Culicoidibacterales bacterium]